MIEAAFFCLKNACQLEGSDHGGRDSAAELALAGTIDVQASDRSCNRLTFGASLIRLEKLYSAKKFRQRLFEFGADCLEKSITCLGKALNPRSEERRVGKE